MPHPGHINASFLRDRAVVRAGFSAAFILSLVLVCVACFLAMVGPQAASIDSERVAKVPLSDSRIVRDVSATRPDVGGPEIGERPAAAL
jgi:hypothetical protein